MARLIDADMLLERISLLKDANLYEVGRIVGLIQTQPTAYDIDKVVEELQELNTYNLNLADTMCDIQNNGTGRTFVCLQDVIEIVKAGGKSENHS